MNFDKNFTAASLGAREQIPLPHLEKIQVYSHNLLSIILRMKERRFLPTWNLQKNFKTTVCVMTYHITPHMALM